MFAIEKVANKQMKQQLKFNSAWPCIELEEPPGSILYTLCTFPVSRYDRISKEKEVNILIFILLWKGSNIKKCVSMVFDRRWGGRAKPYPYLELKKDFKIGI